MMTIKAEPMPGMDITQAFKESIVIANKLNCYVDFNFNGVKCVAHPNGNEDKGALAYHKALTDNQQFKMAFS